MKLLQYQEQVQGIPGSLAPERTTPDKWQSQNNQPVFDVKRQQNTYPLFSFNAFPLPNPEVLTPDKWQPAPNQPLFDIKRPHATFPSFVVDPLQLTKAERVSFD